MNPLVYGAYKLVVVCDVTLGGWVWQILKSTLAVLIPQTKPVLARL